MYKTPCSLVASVHSFVLLAGKMCFTVLNYFSPLISTNLAMLDCIYQMIFMNFNVPEVVDTENRV